jgi:hypothetical protein
MNEENTSTKKNRSLLFIILTAVFAIALVIVLVLFTRTKGDLEKLAEEKEMQRLDLQADLDSLLVEHEQVKQDYGAIADSLLSKDSVIQANAKEIKRLLNTQWEYVKVKRKFEALQEISKTYVVQLDAAVLKAYSIDIQAINIRGSREKETDKARRTHRLDICFTLGENLVIEPGVHTIYLRIAGPDTRILMRGEGDEYAFEFRGEMLQYSVKQDVEYNNEAMEVCMSWVQYPDDPDFEKGQYIVNIFSGDQEIGQKTIVLE